MAADSFVKRILACALVPALLLCAGCGPMGNTSNVSENNANGSAGVQKDPAMAVLPSSAYVARDNSLEIYDPYASNKPVSISGLKDKAVQQKVNDAIRAEYKRLSDPSFVPSGRSVKLYEKLSKGRQDVNIHCVIGANCDDILSVVIYYNRYYALSGDRNERIQLIVPLNFDLSTGEQLSLGDLFPEGFDHRKYLDSRIMEKVRTSDPSVEPSSMDHTYPYVTHEVPQLLGEYRGIREDQPFFLMDKGQLVLVLDSGNTEFFILNGSQGVSFDISEVCKPYAVLRTDAWLYEDSAVRYHLIRVELPGGYYTETKNGSDVKDALPGHFSAVAELRQYPCLTDEQNSFLALDQVNIDDIFAAEAAEQKEYTQKGRILDKMIYISSNAQATGPFLDLIVNYSCNSYWAANGQALSVTDRSRMQCIRRDTNEVLQIGDIFREGSDWKVLLKQALIRWAEAGDADGIDPHSREFGDYLDDMIERIDGFNLFENSLSLSCGENTATEYFSLDPDNMWYFANLFKGIPYECIGYEHLSIFD
ncbi:MAG: hypothetical protein II164_03675 [Firmicutes bacterium]|nr:hypothetical protein [Bacillota bacterium]